MAWGRLEFRFGSCFISAYLGDMSDAEISESDMPEILKIYLDKAT